MAIKRYVADSDNTITNAFEENLSTRGTSANMGASDSMEVFTIWGQRSGSASGASLEKSRVLVKFPINDIIADRAAGDVPSSGSVSFYLRLFNAVHADTLPVNYTLSILPVSQSWDEGYGLDMEGYQDAGVSNWLTASSAETWGSAGGTFHSESTDLRTNDSATNILNIRTMYSASFGDDGTEDVDVDISELVEQWIAGTKSNYGVGVMMSGTYETDELSSSFYTKKFHTRGTEYFYKRPLIEARWDDSKGDDRANLYASSALVSSADNTNTLFLYNWVKGQLKDIPGLHANKTLALKLYRDSLTDNAPQEVTGGLFSPSVSGTYSASFTIDTTASVLYDVWSSGSTEFHTGSQITVNSFKAMAENPNPQYVTSMVNLKSSYSNQETARFRLFIREQNWSPTIYTKATETLDSEIIESAYYKIFRLSDNLEVVPYGTGSTNHTKLSYDQSGSYFDLDMGMLESDFAYGLSFAYYLNDKYVEQPEVFKFRVEE